MIRGNRDELPSHPKKAFRVPGRGSGRERARADRRASGGVSGLPERLCRTGTGLADAGENSGNRELLRDSNGVFSRGSMPFPSPVHGGASPGFPGFIGRIPPRRWRLLFCSWGWCWGAIWETPWCRVSRPLPLRCRFPVVSTDIVSFKAFAAAPPGTLGEGYLRMAHFTEEDRK